MKNVLGGGTTSGEEGMINNLTNPNNERRINVNVEQGGKICKCFNLWIRCLNINKFNQKLKLRNCTNISSDSTGIWLDQFSIKSGTSFCNLRSSVNWNLSPSHFCVLDSQSCHAVVIYFIDNYKITLQYCVMEIQFQISISTASQ